MFSKCSYAFSTLAKSDTTFRGNYPLISLTLTLARSVSPQMCCSSTQTSQLRTGKTLPNSGSIGHQVFPTLPNLKLPWGTNHPASSVFLVQPIDTTQKYHFHAPAPMATPRQCRPRHRQRSDRYRPGPPQRCCTAARRQRRCPCSRRVVQEHLQTHPDRQL